jgi:hypothetical protein
MSYIEKLKMLENKREIEQIELDKKRKEKEAMKKYYALKYEKPISFLKGVGFVGKTIGKGLSKGVREIQEFNSRNVKKKKK